MKPILAVDMDDVLADSISLILKKYNLEFDTNLTKEMIWGKTLYDILPNAHIPIIKNYQNTKGFYQDVPIIEGSQNAIKLLSEKYTIYIVSSAIEFPNSLADRCTFVSENFPSVYWKNIIFGANKSLINADFLIDDMLHNIKSFGDSGFLFTAYHNATIEYPFRVDNWDDVIKKMITNHL